MPVFFDSDILLYLAQDDLRKADKAERLLESGGSISVQRYGPALAERQQLSVYDGMIVASAICADCDTLYSEDMHAGLVIDGRLTIVNPFA